MRRQTKQNRHEARSERDFNGEQRKCANWSKEEEAFADQSGALAPMEEQCARRATKGQRISTLEMTTVSLVPHSIFRIAVRSLFCWRSHEFLLALLSFVLHIGLAPIWIFCKACRSARASRDAETNGQELRPGSPVKPQSRLRVAVTFVRSPPLYAASLSPVLPTIASRPSEMLRPLE